MKKEVDHWHFSWKWFFLLVGIALILYILWFAFFSYKECTNWECFNDRLVGCSKTKFIGGSKMILEYTIRGDSEGLCEVDVELLQGELNNQEQKKIEFTKMSCNLPLGVLMLPESNIGNCHGELKEGLQDIIIKKLHTYLVQNVGQINLEILDAPVS
jgi:hypothetical protein